MDIVVTVNRGNVSLQIDHKAIEPSWTFSRQFSAGRSGAGTMELAYTILRQVCPVAVNRMLAERFAGEYLVNQSGSFALSKHDVRTWATRQV